MIKYKITVEYDGKEFFGWQRQKKFRNTVQESIENTLEKLLKEKVSITGAGRTDTGVHAYNQVAHFLTNCKITDKGRFLYSLNSMLPGSITIKSILTAKENFHARFSAKKREYMYRITTKDVSIGRYYCHKLNYKLDFKVIDEFIKILTGYKSFRSLCKNHQDKHEFFCNLIKLEYKINKSASTITFKIAADRFLHSMVRAIIGLLIDLGRGRIEIKEAIKKFNNGEKIKTTYLPANALFLNKIYY